MQKKTIVFTGGGTGGHVFPGLALAEHLVQEGSYNFLWIGSKTGAEKNYVSTAHYAPMEFIGIPSGKFRRSFSFKNMSDIFNVLWAIQCAKKLLKKLRPSCIVSIGSYVSVPVVLAAHKLGVPIVSVVTDISISLSTKINAKYSSALLFAYESIAEHYQKISRDSKRKSQAIHVAGLPLRTEIFTKDPEAIEKQYGIEKEKKVLLILGGSSGSQEINSFIEYILPSLKKDTVVLHQTGSKEKQRALTKNYIPIPFFSENYGAVLSRANAALSRGGAGSLWELTSRAIPSVVVPLPRTKSRGDQIENAQYFAQRNMLVNLGENPNADTVKNAVQKILYDKAHSHKLRETCLCASSMNAAKIFSRIIKTYT